jgi:hypothetical protein
MAIENPLDKVADVARSTGDAAAGLLGGTARFLEQITGDATSAAIFAALLLFILSLVRGAASARNQALYAKAILVIGIISIFSLFGYSLIMAKIDLSNKYPAWRELSFIYRGYTARDYNIQEPTLYSSVLLLMSKDKWYYIILSITSFTGIVLYVLTRPKNKQPYKSNSSPPQSS